MTKTTTPKALRTKATKLVNKAHSYEMTAYDLNGQMQEMKATCHKMLEDIKKGHSSSDADIIKETTLSAAKVIAEKGRQLLKEAEEMKAQSEELYDQADRLECSNNVGGDEVAAQYLYELRKEGVNGTDFEELWYGYSFYLTGKSDAGIVPDANIVIAAHKIWMAEGRNAMLDYFKGLRNA